jgi:hypothetical protein
MSNFALGNYLWGSLIVRTTRQAAVRGAGVRAFLSAVLDGKAEWEDARQFIAIGTFHHETTHMLQDVTSGCGLWDFHLIVTLLHTANYWNIVQRDTYDYFKQLPAVAARLRENLCDLGIILPDPLRAVNQPVAFAHSASDNPGIPSKSLSVEALLEGEAMIHTEALLQTLKMSPLSRDIMTDHPELHDVTRARGKYSIAYETVFHMLSKYTDSADHARVHAIAKPVFLFLSDISLAFPPRALVGSDTANRTKWFPTVKFAALLKAFDVLSPDELAAVLDSVVSKKPDTEKAEEILCKRTQFAGYPRRRIYQAWLTWLEENEVKQLRPIFEMRRRAIDTYLRSLSKTLYWRTESFRNEAELPWIGLTPMGINWGGACNTQDKKKAIRVLNKQISCLLSYNRERELLMAFAGIRPFVCSVGETRLCPASTSACVSGEAPTNGVAEIPTDDQCSVWNKLLRKDWTQTFRLPTSDRPKDQVECVENPMFSFKHILK